MDAGIWEGISKPKLDSLIKDSLINLGEVVILDEEGRMVYISESYAENMGIPLKESLGKYITDVIPDSVLPSIMKSKTPAFGGTYYRNGNTFWVNRVPLLENGELKGVVAQSILTSNVESDDASNKFGYVMRQLNYYRNKYEQFHVARFGIDNIVSRSTVMEELKESLYNIAKNKSTVLLSGESGTGKEVFANVIHSLSDRSEKPFIKINCAAIPDNLLESELFGYEEGSFTGAAKGGKMGDFEAADSGTIFLDEINTLSLNMQAKLLRVIQEREIKKIGSNKSIPINVRFIFATNSDLLEMVNRGEFRKDFYYRVNVINLKIPPLRDRLEDIGPLIESFVAKYNSEFGKSILGVDPTALMAMAQYDWPGNVRELENCIERAFNYCDAGYLTLNEIEIPGMRKLPKASDSGILPLKNVREQAECIAIKRALDLCDGNKQLAAKALDIDRSVLYDKIKKYGIV